VEILGEIAAVEADRASRKRPTWEAVGIIDLAFEEDDGWVIVDWKTDDVSDEAVLAARRELYQRQVDLYAEAWESLTGSRVKERTISFLHEPGGGSM
jgi:ATP-dependent helicase/nuclease subunit A